jgi:hypothetical protein
MDNNAYYIRLLDRYLFDDNLMAFIMEDLYIAGFFDLEKLFHLYDFF